MSIYTKTGDFGTTHMGMHRIAKIHPVIELMGGIDELSAHLGMVIALIRENESIDQINTDKIVVPLLNAQYILYVLSANIHKHYQDSKDQSNSSSYRDGTHYQPSWYHSLGFLGIETLWTYIKSYWNTQDHTITQDPEFCELSQSKHSKQILSARLSENVISLEKSMDDMENSGLQPLKNFIRPTGNPCTCELHICRTVCRRVERLLWYAKDYQKFDCHEDLVYLNRLSDWLFVCARYIKMLNDENEEYFVMSK